MPTLKDFIARAETAGACSDALAKLCKCRTVEEAFAHDEAPMWAYWYARNVLKARWPGKTS